jgi:hypothetical protein
VRERQRDRGKEINGEAVKRGGGELNIINPRFGYVKS